MLTHYSKGYKLWKALNLIKRAGNEGLTRNQIVKHMYEMVYGKGTYDPKKVSHRMWGNVTYFHFYETDGKNKGGAITHKTNRTKDKKFIINEKGLQYLKNHPEFNDGIKY